MLIAQEKEKTNIAEYILYMWQIEDIIRSHDFDLIQITDSVISKFNADKEVQYDMKLWYQNLIEQMMNSAGKPYWKAIRFDGPPEIKNKMDNLI